jgi:hypothetical protein
MSDFATERAAVLERREKEKGEQLLRARVRHCRQLMAEPRTSLQMPAPKSIEEAARRLFPALPEHELAEIIAAANEPVDRGRTVQTIATSVVKELTRKFLEANREAGARDAWQHVLQHGQPVIQESSFKVLVMTPVRKELGITVGSAVKPRTVGEPLPSRPRPRRREETSARPPVSKQERAARLKAKRSAVEASAETPAPAPKKNGKHRARTTAVAPMEPVNLVAPEPAQRPSPFSDGDAITLQLSGEKLEARRLGGRWLVDVGDSVVEWLLARALVGAR